MSELNLAALTDDIKRWGLELGFNQLGISDIDLSAYRHHLRNWLDKNHHGEMTYMARHEQLRGHPDQLLPGTRRVICARMDYAPTAENSLREMTRGSKAYVARYARGRDYHKLLRLRLQKLAKKIAAVAGPFGYRAFVDSAPVLERALAEKAGLGWIGKNTMLINKQAGSWYFLGELFTDLPLPTDSADSDHCGTCRACLDICPTQAFTSAKQLDATRCISYLTIESRKPIPLDLRPLMGNRIFGCDDCQLVCPWNKFTQVSREKDFSPRHSLDDVELVELFAWTEAEFMQRTEGSAIRRTGYQGWLRNIAVALGNAPGTPEVIAALKSRRDSASELVREHIVWALEQHRRN